MRVDVYLKKTGLIKQRTEAKLACEQGAVTIGGQAAKPARQIREGERIVITYPGRILEVEVLDIPERSVRRSERDSYYRLVEERVRDWDG